MLDKILYIVAAVFLFLQFIRVEKLPLTWWAGAACLIVIAMFLI